MLTMYDAITPSEMPQDGDAYASYVNGSWPNYSQLSGRFPGKEYLSIDVTGAALADALDCERYDVSPSDHATIVSWYRRQVSNGTKLPVLYSSRDAMPTVLAAFSSSGVNVPRSGYRIWSAHYGAGEHICGPSTCGASFNADGTQWLNTPGYDQSTLNDGFFTVARTTTVKAPAKPTAPAEKVLPSPIVAVVMTTVGDGYWMVGAQGETYSFGNAPHFQDHSYDKLADDPVVGAVAEGSGLLLVTRSGAVITYGDAKSRGDLPSEGWHPAK